MDIVEIIIALTPLIATLLILRERIINKKGTGVRTIQILTIAIVVPIIALLKLKNLLDDATLGTLLGALLGYTLSDLAKSKTDQDQ